MQQRLLMTLSDKGGDHEAKGLMGKHVLGPFLTNGVCLSRSNLLQRQTLPAGWVEPHALRRSSNQVPHPLCPSGNLLARTRSFPVCFARPDFHEVDHFFFGRRPASDHQPASRIVALYLGRFKKFRNERVALPCSRHQFRVLPESPHGSDPTGGSIGTRPNPWRQPARATSGSGLVPLSHRIQRRSRARMRGMP